jgi:peptidylprolyl isomerase
MLPGGWSADSLRLESRPMNAKHLVAALALTVAACSKPSAPTTTAADATAGTAASDTAATTTTTTTAAPAATPPATEGAAMDTFAMPANPQTTPSGLKYTIDQPGTGVQPKTGQTVSVQYTGWLTDGTKFDSSHDHGAPLEFPVGRHRVIEGWDEAIGAMKVGEKRTLVIPPELGYGPSGMSGVIPPDATLVFKVELVGVK